MQILYEVNQLVISTETAQRDCGLGLWTVIRIFHKNTELAILTSEALLRKNQKISSKMVAQSVLNLGPQPFKSDALLSELPRHVLLGISLNCLLFPHYFILGLTSFS